MNIDVKEEVIHTDLLIIGGGLAGLIAANKAKETGVDVLVVDKATVGWAGQAPMAGGFTWVIAPDDDLDTWAKWQVKKGDYLNDQDWVYFMARQSYACIQEMVNWGMPFETDEHGNIKLTKQLGFPDAFWGVKLNAGNMVLALRDRALNQGVNIVNKIQITDLINESGRVVGAAGFHRVTGCFYRFQSKATILANGSCDFQVERLFSGSCGEGIAAAYKAGAEMRNAEFGNFYGPKMKEIDAFFRGILVYQFENRFGDNISGKYISIEDGEELGRLVLGMAREEMAGRGPVYLDFAALPADFDDSGRPADNHPSNPFRIADRLNKILPEPLQSKNQIIPAFLGKLSPVKVDMTFKTTLSGLWAIGDTSHLGSAWEGAIPGGEVPGLCISYAIISGLHSGEIAAGFAAKTQFEEPVGPLFDQVKQNIYRPLTRKKGLAPAKIIYALQTVIYPVKYNLVRSRKWLKKGLKQTLRLQKKLSQLRAEDYHALDKCHEAESMVLCAEMMFRAALRRKESRGSHIREDYPMANDSCWLKWIVIQQKNGKMNLREDPIPYSQYRIQPQPRRKSMWTKDYPGSFASALSRGLKKDHHRTIQSIPHRMESETLITDLGMNVTQVFFYDLEDHIIRLRNFYGQTVILVGGGQTIAGEVEKWVTALENEFLGRESVQIFKLAIIGKLPPFISKSVAKYEMQKATGKSPFLIRWEVESGFEFQLLNNNTPHIFVVNPDGQLGCRLIGNYSAQNWGRLREKIDL